MDAVQHNRIPTLTYGVTMTSTLLMSEVLATAKYVQQHVKSGKPWPRRHAFKLPTTSDRMPAPELTCKDGFRLSLQASASHYCEPRNDQGPYDSFELLCGYDPLIDEYWDSEEPCSYVPLELVIELICEHGGISHILAN